MFLKRIKDSMKQQNSVKPVSVQKSSLSKDEDSQEEEAVHHPSGRLARRTASRAAK